MAHEWALHSEAVDAKYALGRAHLEDLIIISLGHVFHQSPFRLF